MADLVDYTYTVKGSGIEAMLQRLSEVSGKSVGKIINDRAMTYARYLAFNTQPVANSDGSAISSTNFIQNAPAGGSVKSKKLGQAAVDRDIRRVYTSAAKLINYLKRNFKNGSGKSIAGAFSAAVKAGRYIEAKNILRRANVPGASFLDVMAWDHGARHSRLKKNPRGRIPRGTKEVVVDLDKDIKTYSHTRQKMVGFTKSGWINAAKPISTRGSGSVAQWIKGQRGQGRGLDMTSDPNNPRIVLYNNVPWVSQCMSQRTFVRTVETFERILKQEIDAILKHEADKANRASSANP
jgi:hypothetical protein